jgi:hypothetical protein
MWRYENSPGANQLAPRQQTSKSVNFSEPMFCRSSKMCYSEVSRISKVRILFSAKIKYLQSKSAGFGDVQIDQKRFFFLDFFNWRDIQVKGY